jgi:RNA polymerase sigma-70 factor, ECF subfamily
LASPEHEQVDYDRLYREHHAAILRLCRLLLSDAAEAEEVAQDVFLKAVRYWRAKGAPQVWRKWLQRVAVNGCRDRWRSAWWRWRKTQTSEFDESIFPSQLANPEQQAIQRQQIEHIWRRFDTLPGRQREIFVLRHLEGWTPDEIAEALGTSTASVKMHLFRAVHKLRGAIGENVQKTLR